MKSLFVLSLSGMLLLSGCATTAESVNEGATSAGQTTGKILRIPNRFGKGVSEGLQKEDPKNNPMGR